MKILYIVQRFHTNLYWRLKALARAGHEVFVLVNQSKEGQEKRSDEINFIILKESRFHKFFRWLASWNHLIYFDIPSLTDLRTRINEIKPDVIVARNLNSWRTIFAFIFGRKTNYLFTEIQTEEYYFSNPFKRLMVKLLVAIFRLQGIITPLKNHLEKADKLFKYLPFVIETADFKKNYFTQNQINIIAVGKFMPRKDHLILLEAVKFLADKHPMKLTIIGQSIPDKTNYEAVKKSVIDNGLEKIVTIMNDLPIDEVSAIYRGQDLFVLPAYNEPASYSVLEAMAAKLPVIASDTCGTSCYIERGANGQVFKSHSAADLAAKIEEIIKDKDKLIKMGERSFELAREAHSPQNFVHEFEKICLEK